MTIYFFVDPYCLSDTQTETITDPATIPGWRKRIEDLLARHPNQNLTIRINTNFFQRLADFEGMHGVEVKRVIPRDLLEERLECSLPEWLGSEACQVKLCHLPLRSFSCTVADTRLDTATWRILAFIDTNLVTPTNVDVWLTALAELASCFPGWLRLVPVQSVLAVSAPLTLEPAHLTTLYAFLDVFPTPNTAEQIREDVWWEPLRDLATLADGVLATVLALPPRRLPSEILQRLQVYPPHATDELARVWQNAGEHVVNLISQGIFQSDALARLASAPWPSWWAWLADQLPIRYTRGDKKQFLVKVINCF